MKEIETTIHNAKTHLSKYLAMLERREIDRVIIKRRNEIVGELKPPPLTRKPKLIFGLLKGKIDGEKAKAELDLTTQETMEEIESSIDRMIKDHLS